MRNESSTSRKVHTMNERHGFVGASVRLPLLCAFVLIAVLPLSLHAQGGWALGFNGSSDLVTITDNSIDLSGDFTVEFWVKFNDVSSGQMIMSKNRGGQSHSYEWELGVSMDGDGLIRFEVGSSTPWAFQQLASTTVLTAGTWYHVAATFEGTAMSLYINGTLDNGLSNGLTRWTDNVNPPLVLGAPTLGSSDGYFNGVLDEVRIWNVARSASDIQSTMNAELTGNETGLMAYYSMNAGSGSALSDDQSNGTGNSGIISGATWLSSTAPLPIQLATFAATASPAERSVSLAWTTKSEVDNYGFEVQRSTDAKSGFTSVSPLIPGHGTSASGFSYSYSDDNVPAGLHFYRLKQIDLDGSAHFTEPVIVQSLTGVDASNPVPTVFSLNQNYPNPFNPTTTISYGLPKATTMTLSVYNAIGQHVATLVEGQQSAGYHQATFDGSQLSSGVYLYRLEAGTFVATRTLVMVK